jgi:translation initiation factor 1A
MANKDKLKDLQNAAPVKARIPKDGEYIGIVEKRLGGSRMVVRKTDGTEIMARVPGRAKKYLWIREGDIVLLQPWELDKDKADLVYKYKPVELKVLAKKGFDVTFESIEEF